MPSALVRDRPGWLLAGGVGLLRDRGVHAPGRGPRAQRTMPGAYWFPGARLNYAGHILRRRLHWDALLFAGETVPLAALSWDNLATQVRILATQLRALGVQPGDRVAAYLPNVPHTVIAMLATASIGAIWTSCSPDFGWRGVLDRFRQLSPVVLICTDGYRYGGRDDRYDETRHIAAGLPSLRHMLIPPAPARPRTPAAPGPGRHQLGRDHERPGPARGRLPARAGAVLSPPTLDLVLLRHHRPAQGHHPQPWRDPGRAAQATDVPYGRLRPGDRMLFYTTTGWMMWNFLVSSLLLGVQPVLYDGNPGYPGPDVLWRLAQDARVTFFGASPAYVDALTRAKIVPGRQFGLDHLNAVMLAGSPVSAECSAWSTSATSNATCGWPPGAAAPTPAAGWSAVRHAARLRGRDPGPPPGRGRLRVLARTAGRSPTRLASWW